MTSAGWKHGNRTSIPGGHGKSMATKNEKLMIGPMGKQFQPTEHNYVKTCVPAPSNNVHTEAM